MAPSRGEPAVIWVVVLGEFGRSPRMMYHTLSLSDHGYRVKVIATGGSAQPLQAITDASNIAVCALPEPPAWALRLPSLLPLLVKALFQLGVLLWLMLARLERPAAILLQNPPAIPTMLVCLLAAARHRAAFIVDWHNLAYTILALKHGRHGWFIALARAYERLLGARAAGHFTVTAAMQAFLLRDFGVRATLLHDRPPAFFQLCDLEEAHALLARLQPTVAANALGAAGVLQRAGLAGAGGASSGAGASLVAEQAEAAGSGGQRAARQQQQIRPRQGRPALVVSSTSWTPDEDFGILLEAACSYDAAAAAGAESASAGGRGRLPDVLFLITGRGPQREHYLRRIGQLQLRHVAFCSLWLEAEDYPRLLGAADLGVCLHTSSSGLDLPMKVVDMFGAGLPVCAVDYACVQELITPGRTGLLFRSAAELAAQLQRLLAGFSAGPAEGAELERLRAGVLADQSSWRWADNWDCVAAPVFAAAAAGRRLPEPEMDAAADAGPLATAPAAKERGPASPGRQRRGSGRTRAAA